MENNLNLLKSNIPVLLKAEGILSKGYGLIPKEIVLNPDLSIEAKAIFSFLSCHTGVGESAFPKRDTILKALGISKDRFYKHFNLLLENGYVTVTQDRKSHGKFTSNIYTINYNLEKGFGFVPRLVMYDERLSIGEKGLYSLYLSFAGAGQDSLINLKKNDIMYFLNIAHNKFVKLNNSLLERNLIVSTQKHVNGRFAEAQVKIVLNPNDEIEFRRTVTTINNEIQQTQNKDTVLLQETQNKDTVKQDTQNKDTVLYNNNNLKNNIELNTNKESAHEFISKFGSLVVSEKEHQILYDTFENIEGLYERAILALAQRNVMPKSTFHFIAELGRKEKWPERALVEDKKIMSTEELEKMDTEELIAYLSKNIKDFRGLLSIYYSCGKDARDLDIIKQELIKYGYDEIIADRL